MTGICIMGKMREDRSPVKWNKRFIYPKSQRSLIEGKRHYDIDDTKQTKLPSVTTIISATQSDEKRQALANWKARLGAQAADRVRDIAALTRHSHAHVSRGVCSGLGAQGPNQHWQGSRTHGAKDYRSRARGPQ